MNRLIDHTQRLLTACVLAGLIVCASSLTACDKKADSEPPDAATTPAKAVADGATSDGNPAGAANSDEQPEVSQAPAPKTSEVPPKADSRLERGREYILRNQFPAARTVLTPLVRDYPRYARAEFYLALAVHKSKDYGAARTHFENVLASDGTFPEFSATNYYYGWCVYNLGELKLARSAFERFLKDTPGQSDAHFGIGLIDYDEGRMDEAKAQFLEAIDLIMLEIANDPRLATRRRAELSKCHARLSDVYVRQEKLELACDHLIESTTIWPDHYTAQFKLYRVLTRLGEDEAAAEALEAHDAAKKRVRPELVDPE